MKVVLLAGGFGTRISEESQFKPKPMIEIGDKGIHEAVLPVGQILIVDPHLHGICLDVILAEQLTAAAAEDRQHRSKAYQADRIAGPVLPQYQDIHDQRDHHSDDHIGDGQEHDSGKAQG